MNQFHKFSNAVAQATGSSWAFICAALLIFGWAVMGPIAQYSATWELFINTGTTIITFLMVFLIQNTQNRDNKAVHLKLDEMLRSDKAARTSMAKIENLSDKDLEKIDTELTELIQTEEPK